MEFPTHIFRSYDIRGLIEEVTEDIAERAGYFLVQKTNAKTVVVGRDMRSTSPALAQAAIHGITQAGANVLDIGMVTTSLYNYATSTLDGIDAGLMITASHNPAEYNGIKLGNAQGLPFSGKEMLEVIQGEMIASENIGNVEQQNVVDAYLDHCLSLLNMPELTGTKLAIDYGNGMGSVTIAPLLERLGVDVVELYKEPDARFPNHEANPAKEETLKDVQALIQNERVDFGIALDGDADRIGFIDEHGESLRGDQMVGVFATYFANANQKANANKSAKAITAANYGWAALKQLDALGIEQVMSRIGRTHIIALMKEHNADFGGETSSHFYFKDFSGLESVDYALLLALKIWKESGVAFSELAAPMRKYINSGEVNTEVEHKDKILQAIREHYIPLAETVNEMDGLRCEFADWWFIVRPSNTEPLLRLTVEAETQALMEEKRDEIAKLMNLDSSSSHSPQRSLKGEAG